MSLVTIATIAADLIIEDLNAQIATRTGVHSVYFWGVTGMYGVQFATYIGGLGSEHEVFDQSQPMFATEDEAYAAGAAALDALEADGELPAWCSAGN